MGIYEGFTHKAVSVKNSGLFPRLESFTNRVSGRPLLEFPASLRGDRDFPLSRRLWQSRHGLTWDAEPATPVGRWWPDAAVGQRHFHYRTWGRSCVSGRCHKKILLLGFGFRPGPAHCQPNARRPACVVRSCLSLAGQSGPPRLHAGGFSNCQLLTGVPQLLQLSSCLFAKLR